MIDIKVKKRVHPIYKEMGSTRLSGIGKDWYTFETDEAEVSLIHILSVDGSRYLWECFCIKGDLFEDCIRFDRKKEAIEYIVHQLLK